MTFGSLFSGGGLFDLGLESAGLKCAWQVENDADCRAVLAKHWPEVPRHDDVRDFPPKPTKHWRADVIAGGFPCQPVSVAGKRRGTSDERWLWPEFARVLRVLRPRFAILENTPGLFTAGFDAVLADLAALGFDAEWSVLSACALGAPHTRERLFVVAYPAGLLGEEGLRLRESAAAHEIQARSVVAARVLRMEAAHRDDGVPDEPFPRVDVRRRIIGNGVYPDCAELIGRMIIEANQESTTAANPGSEVRADGC